jgi:hypothetical protein
MLLQGFCRTFGSNIVRNGRRREREIRQRLRVLATPDPAWPTTASTASRSSPWSLRTVLTGPVPAFLICPGTLLYRMLGPPPGVYVTGVRNGRIRIGLIIAAASVGFATVGVPAVGYGAGRPADARSEHRHPVRRVGANDVPGSELPAPPSAGYLAPLNGPGEDSDPSPAVVGAVSRARSSGHPAVVGPMTTQTMTVSALPHGGFRLRESLLPVRVRQLVRRNGRLVRQWVPVSTALRRAGGVLRPVAVPGDQVAISDGGAVRSPRSRRAASNWRCGGRGGCRRRSSRARRRRIPTCGRGSTWW